MNERTPRLRGSAAVKQRARRMHRTKSLCEHCQAKGFTRAAKFVDHITALANGGTDEDSNTQNLCKPCHDAKTAEDFGHRRKQQIGRDGWPVA